MKEYVVLSLVCMGFVRGMMMDAMNNRSLLDHPVQPLHQVGRLTRVAFGSCNDQSKPQFIWKSILERKPQLWIWMGDNIYGDRLELGEVQSYYPKPNFLRPSNPDMLFNKYSAAIQGEGYRKLLETVPVIGTWDDHDYGINDGDKTYEFKKESQQLFFDFIGEPIESVRRKQSGVYSAHMFGPPGQQVKFLMLDVRFNKDPTAIEDGEMLGTEQWDWLLKELETSEAAFNIIVSGTQVLADDKFFKNWESWCHYPTERRRLIETLLKSKAKGIVLLSGDVHHAEINQLHCADDTLYEVTSSGMTHAWLHQRHEYLRFVSSMIFWIANSVLPFGYRRTKNDFFGDLNFGEIEFDWDSSPPFMHVGVLSHDNQIKLKQTIVSEAFSSPETSVNSTTCLAPRPVTPFELQARQNGAIACIVLGVSLCILVPSLSVLICLYYMCSKICARSKVLRSHRKKWE